MSKVQPGSKELVPIKFVYLIGSLIAATLLFVGYAKFSNLPMVGVPPKSGIVEERALQFVANDRLHISVLDLNNRVIAVSSENNNGFLSVVYNAFQVERKKKRIEASNLLRLVSYSNGRLVLIDDSTGLEIQLSSFGKQNAEVFGRLLMK